MYKNVYTKLAVEDIPRLTVTHLDTKTKTLLDVICENPYQSPPSYEKTMGDLQRLYSRRININWFIKS